MTEDGGKKHEATALYVEARAVCAGCEVRAECLEWGMTDTRWGMYGGLTPKERRALRTAERAQSAAV